MDISKLPAINRKIAEGKTSATELSKLVLREQKLKARIKALKWLKGEELGEEEMEKPAHLSDEQASFLVANGIQIDRGGSFNPPTEKDEPKDFYMAKTFEIKLAGLASLPPVKKVAEKVASAKVRTPVEALIEEGLKEWASVKAKVSDKPAKLKWFESAISPLQSDLKGIRAQVQGTKFQVLLSKKWFSEFKTRDNCELSVDGVKCQFVLGEQKVPV